MSSIREIGGLVVPMEGGKPPGLGGRPVGEGDSFENTLRSLIDSARAQELGAEARVNDFTSQASGKIHETTLAVSQAEISFRLLMSVRNRLIEAYREIMRMSG